MLYIAKCYWPGVRKGELERLASAAAMSCSDHRVDAVAHLGTLVLVRDEFVLCLFEGPSHTVLRLHCDRLGIPSERLIDAAWLAPAAGAPAHPSVHPKEIKS
ncbi:MAG TPA: hypothetical protein VEF89_02610 [Solirubrobacteraceae bacterium]|nr:hypothetical protein [Solirubrobacteraceae bacterium]